MRKSIVTWEMCNISLFMFIYLFMLEGWSPLSTALIVSTFPAAFSFGPYHQNRTSRMCCRDFQSIWNDLRKCALPARVSWVVAWHQEQGHNSTTRGFGSFPLEDIVKKDVRVSCAKKSGLYHKNPSVRLAKTAGVASLGASEGLGIVTT